MPGASEATYITVLGDKHLGHDTPDAVDALDRFIAATAHQLPVQLAFEARGSRWRSLRSTRVGTSRFSPPTSRRSSRHINLAAVHPGAARNDWRSLNREYPREGRFPLDVTRFLTPSKGGPGNGHRGANSASAWPAVKLRRRASRLWFALVPPRPTSSLSGRGSARPDHLPRDSSPGLIGGPPPWLARRRRRGRRWCPARPAARWRRPRRRSRGRQRPGFGPGGFVGGRRRLTVPA
jgi:hypothetical protein